MPTAAGAGTDVRSRRLAKRSTKRMSPGGCSKRRESTRGAAMVTPGWPTFVGRCGRQGRNGWFAKCYLGDPSTTAHSHDRLRAARRAGGIPIQRRSAVPRRGSLDCGRTALGATSTTDICRAVCCQTGRRRADWACLTGCRADRALLAVAVHATRANIVTRTRIPRESVCTPYGSSRRPNRNPRWREGLLSGRRRLRSSTHIRTGPRSSWLIA